MKRSKWMIINLIVAVIAITIVSNTACFAGTSNLVINGDASDGLSNWTDLDKVWVTVTECGIVKAYDSYFFYPKFKGPDGASTRIYQDVNVKDFTGMKATLSAYNRTWDPGHTDESMLTIEFFNSSGSRISLVSSIKDHGNANWHLLSVSTIVPQNAAVARVSLYAIYHYGSAVDSFFDNVSLIMSETTPTPTPMPTVTPTLTATLTPTPIPTVAPESKKIDKPGQVKWKSQKKKNGYTILTWERIKKNCKGYEIQISTKSSFKSKYIYDKIEAKSNDKTVLNLRNFNNKKTVYVRVRAFNTNGYIKKYGKWSTKKTVKKN